MTSEMAQKSSMWQAEVQVWLKPGVFDPQGSAIERSLRLHGHQGVSEIRVGKCMTLSIAAATAVDAEQELKRLCETVLCNPVIERFTYQLTEQAGDGV